MTAEGKPIDVRYRYLDAAKSQQEKGFKARRSPFSVYDPVLYNLSPKQESLLRDIEYKDYKMRRLVIPGLKARKSDYKAELAAEQIHQVALVEEERKAQAAATSSKPLRKRSGPEIEGEATTPELSQKQIADQSKRQSLELLKIDKSEQPKANNKGTMSVEEIGKPIENDKNIKQGITDLSQTAEHSMR